MSSNRLGHLRLAAVVAVGALLIAGCGNNSGGSDVPAAAASVAPASSFGSSDLIAAAEQEGQLTFYSAYSDSVNDDINKTWAKLFPKIKLNTIRLGSSDLSTRFGSESAKGVRTADVLVNGDASIARSDPQYFADLTTTAVPAVAQYDKKYITDKAVQADNTPQGIDFNSDMVQSGDVPKGWKDLIDPKWKGKGIMIDPRAFPASMSFYQQALTAYGPEFLTALGKQGFKLSDSGTPAGQEVAAGGHQIAFPVLPSQIVSLQRDSAPIKNFQPADAAPQPAQVHYLLLPAQPPHPNAAKLFANWVIDAKGGQVIVCADHYGSVNPDAPGCPAVPPGSNFKQLDADQVTAAQQATVLKLLGLS